MNVRGVFRRAFLIFVGIILQRLAQEKECCYNIENDLQEAKNEASIYICR